MAAYLSNQKRQPTCPAQKAAYVSCQNVTHPPAKIINDKRNKNSLISMSSSTQNEQPSRSGYMYNNNGPRRLFAYRCIWSNVYGPDDIICKAAEC